MPNDNIVPYDARLAQLHQRQLAALKVSDEQQADRLALEHAEEDAEVYAEFGAQTQVDAELDLGEIDEDEAEDRYLQLVEELYEHHAAAGYEHHFLRLAEHLDETREDRAYDLAEDQAQRELDRAGQQCEVAS